MLSSPEKLSIISVIPMKSFNMSDDDLKKAVKEKAKSLQVREIGIHRSDRGVFIHSDVLIKPVGIDVLKKTDFLFENCQVIPCQGYR